MQTFVYNEEKLNKLIKDFLMSNKYLRNNAIINIFEDKYIQDAIKQNDFKTVFKLVHNKGWKSGIITPILIKADINFLNYFDVLPGLDYSIFNMMPGIPLEEINLPNNINTLMTSSIYVTHDLKKLTIPSSIKFIERGFISGVVSNLFDFTINLEMTKDNIEKRSANSVEFKKEFIAYALGLSIDMVDKYAKNIKVNIIEV